MTSTMPDASRSADRMPCAAASSAACVGVAEDDRAGALRRQRRQPAVQRGQHPVGGHHRQRRPAAALTEQHRHRRGVQRDQLGQALGDLAGQPALLGLGRQRRAGGVDHQHQRQPQIGGQRHAATGLAQRSGPDRARRRHPLLAEHHRGLTGEPGQRQQRGRRLALTGTRQQHPVGGAVPQQVPDTRPVRPSRRHHRVPRRHVGHRFGRRPRRWRRRERRR